MKIHLNNNIKVLIIDLDGTLINSSLTVLQILNQIRKKYFNKKKLHLKKISPYLSIGGETLIKKSLEIKKAYEINYYLEIFRKIYLNKKFNYKEIFPFVLKFLRKVKKRNIKIIICTNKNSKLVRKIMNESALGIYINSYVTSDLVGSYKPDKIFLEFILKKYNISKEKILYIGDSIVDVKLCKNYKVNFLIYINHFSDISPKIMDSLKKKKLTFNDYRNLII